MITIEFLKLVCPLQKATMTAPFTGPVILKQTLHMLPSTQYQYSLKDMIADDAETTEQGKAFWASLRQNNELARQAAGAASITPDGPLPGDLRAPELPADDTDRTGAAPLPLHEVPARVALAQQQVPPPGILAASLPAAQVIQLAAAADSYSDKDMAAPAMPATEIPATTVIAAMKAAAINNTAPAGDIPAVQQLLAQATAAQAVDGTAGSSTPIGTLPPTEIPATQLYAQQAAAQEWQLAAPSLPGGAAAPPVYERPASAVIAGERMVHSQAGGYTAGTHADVSAPDNHMIAQEDMSSANNQDMHNLRNSTLNDDYSQPDSQQPAGGTPSQNGGGAGQGTAVNLSFSGGLINGITTHVHQNKYEKGDIKAELINLLNEALSDSEII